MNKRLKKILLPLIFAIITGLLVFFAPFYEADAYLCDMLYSHMTGPDFRIKIIAIDEETLDAYGNFAHWSREKSADLVNLLCQNEETKPAILGFDIMFVGESSGQKEADEALAEACEKAGNVVLATNLVYRGKVNEDGDGELYYDTFNIETEEMPYDDLNAVTDSGFANLLLAKDGIVRHTQVFADTPGGFRKNFAFCIYEKYMEDNGIKADIPRTNKNSQAYFFYSGEVGEYSTFSLCDVLDGTVSADEFKDSIVLVGAYAPGMQDAYRSSADHGMNMYGVEINANLLQAFMEGKTAVDASALLHALILALVVFVFYCIAKKQKIGIMLLEAAILAAVHIFAGRILALNGYIISQFYGLVILGIMVIFLIIQKYLIERLHRKKTLSVFKQYMAPQVVDKLTKGNEFELHLGGEKRDVAVMFVDIRGFTPMSENLNPEQVVGILNEYLSLTTECIFKHNGMLDKFIGDATMAVFNAPFDLEDYLYEAVATAWDIKNGSAGLEKKLMEKFGKTVSFGIGVNCGEAVVGNIGCKFRMDYTAIGDTVNTAARLESRAEKGQILISEKLYLALKDRILAEEIGEMSLKGKSEKILVYQVTGIEKSEA